MPLDTARKMGMRRASGLGSTLSHDVADFAMPEGQFRYDSQGLDDQIRHSSFHAISLADPPKTYAPAPSSTAADMGFNPWLMEVPPYDSPLSRTSSLSGSEHYSTPPPYMETPMYPATNQALQPCAAYLMRDTNYDHSQELAWESQPGVGGSVLLQPPCAQSSVSMWHEGSYGGPSLPPMEYYAQPFMSDTASTLVQSVAHLRLHHQTSTANGGSDAEDILSESDSEDEDSEYDDSSSCQSSRTTSAAVLRLGKWGHGSDCFSQPPQRHYVCPRPAKTGILDDRCKQSFARPEHLRRHMRTVHSDLRPYACKVPRCDKAFSRGDNLRDHYWTHIQRGGRAGKNEKMSFDKLKDILGPREKKLTRKLRQRLFKTRMRMRAKL
ncbi:hypothetical protein BDU57DRAFT_519864 [Ampelomyces quisqualis]|uniref:C2H2 type master regulator of conidiophore development brlA n=1 Tax=Ampelomyces quisqualis TaxID=50730 RepID=A0A6A5QH68_AMPQU|nr:hypothetical protein BDU57DRAFT_519864 [Ampelomyces quisqualis]